MTGIGYADSKSSLEVKITLIFLVVMIRSSLSMEWPNTSRWVHSMRIFPGFSVRVPFRMVLRIRYLMSPSVKDTMNWLLLNVSLWPWCFSNTCWSPIFTKFRRKVMPDDAGHRNHVPYLKSDLYPCVTIWVMWNQNNYSVMLSEIKWIHDQITIPSTRIIHRCLSNIQNQ